jgi:hypothetical protein
MIYGLIPSHINPDELVKDVNGTKRMKDPIKNGVVYILSCISYHTLLKEGRDEFVFLNKRVLDEIIGKGRDINRVKIIVDLLKSNGIIDTIPPRQKKHSTGFMFRQKHKTEDFKKEPYGDRISEIIQKFYKNIEGVFSEEITYPYLTEQFNKYPISFDNLIYEHLQLVVTEILGGFSSKKKLRLPSTLLLVSYIGRLLFYIDKIERNQNYSKVSLSNNRYSSILTNTPKLLRNYMIVENESLCEIDIVSCQPYFLSTILFPDFNLRIEDNGFNLKSIFPELYNVLNSVGYISPFNNGNRNHNILNCYLDDEEFESLNRFRNIDFTSDFYSQVVDLLERRNIKTSRKHIKKIIMSYLFDGSELNRKNHKLQILFDEYYFGLNRFIERFNSIWKKREFSLLLQRTESFVLQKNVIKDFISEHPHVPIYTIHDGIYTTHQYGELVESELRNRVFSFTQTPLGIHRTIKTPNYESLKETIHSKVKVSSSDEYNRKSKGVYKMNVEKGFQFVFPNGNEELREFIDQFYI